MDLAKQAQFILFRLKHYEPDYLTSLHPTFSAALNAPAQLVRKIKCHIMAVITAGALSDLLAQATVAVLELSGHREQTADSLLH